MLSARWPLRSPAAETVWEALAQDSCGIEKRAPGHRCGPPRRARRTRGYGGPAPASERSGPESTSPRCRACGIISHIVRIGYPGATGRFLAASALGEQAASGCRLSRKLHLGGGQRHLRPALRDGRQRRRLGRGRDGGGRRAAARKAARASKLAGARQPAGHVRWAGTIRVIPRTPAGRLRARPGRRSRRSPRCTGCAARPPPPSPAPRPAVPPSASSTRSAGNSSDRAVRKSSGAVTVMIMSDAP